MPAEITPLSNTRNLYWETPPGNLGTWEQSRNPFRLSHDSAGTSQGCKMLRVYMLRHDYYKCSIYYY